MKRIALILPLCLCALACDFQEQVGDFPDAGGVDAAEPAPDGGAPSCTDQKRNGDETGIDCGGSCSGCGPGVGCAKDSDCAAGRCVSLKCASWSVQKLEQTSPITMHELTLAFSPSDEPAVAYVPFVSGGSQLRYATRKGTSWSFQDVGPGGGVPALVFSKAGVPSIGNRGRVYTLEGTTWKQEVLDADNWDVVLAWGKDELHAAFRAGASGKTSLKHAVRKAGGWTSEVVDSSTKSGFEMDLAIDAAGVPWIAHSSDQAILKVAHWTGSAWTSQGVETVGTAWSGKNTLRFGAADAVHLAYTVFEPKPPATWDSTSKHVVLGSAAMPWSRPHAFGVSMALDAQGNPHLCYQLMEDPAMTSRGSLRYARWTGSTWADEVIESYESMPAVWSSLALDSKGVPAVAFARVNRETPSDTNPSVYFARPPQ